MSPEAALEIARRFIAEERPWAVVAELLEDSEDYFVKEELRPGLQWPLGPGPLFISKATGELRTEAFGNVLDKIDAMQSV